jgi:hypothetical protein
LLPTANLASPPPLLPAEPVPPPPHLALLHLHLPL